MFSTRFLVSSALFAVIFICKCKGVPVAKPEDGALVTVSEATTQLIQISSNSTEIDTLTETDSTGVRVKRSGCGVAVAANRAAVAASHAAAVASAVSVANAVPAADAANAAVAGHVAVDAVDADVADVEDAREADNNLYPLKGVISLQNLRIAHLNKIENENKPQPEIGAIDFETSSEEITTPALEVSPALRSQTTHPLIAKLKKFSPGHFFSDLHNQFKSAVRQLVL
ncbi:unnamed protein product, partial [Mesorhabditis belari]|uniref:Uncharacterized protein n=1 Tax=Mesorhabditis belari TaxID=2138241 RepID=A0AAF3EET0_9BILA